MNRTSLYRILLPLALSSAAFTMPSFAQQPSALHGPSFVPDAKFAGSSLNGWHTLGHAEWSAVDGQITGKAGDGAGGWLILDRPYQDTGVYASFRCAGACDTGVLLRMEKTAEGSKGTYLSIKGSQLDAENLTLDTAGKIVGRKTLSRVGGMIRFASESPASPAVPRAPSTPPNSQPGVVLPITRPPSDLRTGEWNEIEVLLDADILRAFLNEGAQQVNDGIGDLDDYGPLAFYVGGGSEVTFKDVAYKDLRRKVQPREQVGKGFHVQRLSPFYYNWSAAAADFNHDGTLDIVSGAFIYMGPDYTTRQEIYPAETTNPSNQYATLIQHAYDFTGDGWPDVLVTNIGGGVGATLYVNPREQSRRWKKYKVIPSIQSEETLLRDVDGDGKPELVYIADGYMRYAKPDPANPTGPWTVHTISEKGLWPAHGIGVGDINGDGRMDIVAADGWWEQPPAGAGQDLWRYHPEAFGRWGRIGPGGATIGVYDVNGDGLNDIVTSLEAHGWGLAWFEQKRSSNGQISFIKHMVMDNYNTQNAGGVTFAELHGSAVADVDGDGIPDFIVGKRQWSHNDDFLDPDPYGPAVLYWYKTVRDPKAPGGAKLVPELIHNSSGAGSDVLAIDLNGDGNMDIVTSTKLGTYIFWGEGAAGKGSKVSTLK